MGFQPEMFTVMFAIPRTVGWLARGQEMSTIQGKKSPARGKSTLAIRCVSFSRWRCAPSRTWQPHKCGYLKRSNETMKVIVLIMLFLTLSVGLAVAAGDAVAGKAVYDKTCKTCHGPTGVANPNIVK